MDFERFLRIFNYFSKRVEFNDVNYSCNSNGSDILGTVALSYYGVVSIPGVNKLGRFRGGYRGG